MSARARAAYGDARDDHHAAGILFDVELVHRSGDRRRLTGRAVGTSIEVFWAGHGFIRFDARTKLPRERRLEGWRLEVCP